LTFCAWYLHHNWLVIFALNLPNINQKRPIYRRFFDLKRRQDDLTPF
jgi:hypothetical protein